MEDTNKVAILGSGNIGLSLARGLVKSAYCTAENITLTRRNIHHLTAEMAQGYQVSDLICIFHN